MQIIKGLLLVESTIKIAGPLHLFSDQVSVAPYNFRSPVEAEKSLRGVTTHYDTYWACFPNGGSAGVHVRRSISL